MRDITNAYVSVPRFLINCPDCGCPSIALFDDFKWVCPDCGFEFQDKPECYLTPGEVIDWKCGMWEPKGCAKKGGRA